MARNNATSLTYVLKADREGGANRVTAALLGDWLERIEVVSSELDEGASLVVRESDSQIELIRLSPVNVGFYPIRLQACNSVGQLIAGYYNPYSSQGALEIVVENGGAGNEVAVCIVHSEDYPG